MPKIRFDQYKNDSEEINNYLPERTGIVLGDLWSNSLTFIQLLLSLSICRIWLFIAFVKLTLN